MANYDAVIVGAGVSGLIAAKELESYKFKTLVIDAAPQVGGRLKSDQLDGYLMDHGFQVLLSAYPMVKKHLDLKALKTKAFSPGAFLFNGKESILVQDVNRNSLALIPMIFSAVGSISDKLKMAKLRKQVMAQSPAEIYDEKDQSTMAFLKDYGFSKRIIERFFQPFFGGIFLEFELETSSRQFLFIFKMFAEGDALLPEKGIEAVAQQLKSQLEKTEFRLNTKVKEIKQGKVILEDGDEIEAQQVIVATDPQELIPQLKDSLDWNQTLQLYFEGSKGPFSKKLISLSYAKNALINNVACLSAVQGAYAKSGKQLYSISLKRDPGLSENELEEAVLKELYPLLGLKSKGWKLLRSFKVKKALPRIDQVVYERPFEESRLMEGIYLAGDFLLNPSLNGAMLSGELAAKALILNHQKSWEL